MTNVKIVIGGNFGDEGKGLMTAAFAKDMMKRSGSCLVVMSNGGAQRGHTVVNDSCRHVFRHFGSGTLYGADTWFPADFIVNPMIFAGEYQELQPDSKVFIHPDCPVTTPFEMITNLILEEHRGNKRHGSVGVGIWETVIGNGKRFGELMKMQPGELALYLGKDRKERMKKRLSEQGVDLIPEEWKEVVSDPGLTEHYIKDFLEMKNRVTVSEDKILKQYSDIIFENGQGLLLDRDMLRKGYGHHTTPSHTGIRNPARIIRDVYGQDPGRELSAEAVYVTRSYMTRHGAGRFDTECPADRINPGIRDLTNQPNPSQGTLRFGTLNMESFLRRAKRDFAEWERITGRACEFSVAMTHLNEFRHPGSRKKEVKYRSCSEKDDLCAILKS